MTGPLTRRTRLCMTEAQWRELNARTNRGVQDMQGSAGGSPGCLAGMRDVACNPDVARPPEGGPIGF